MKENAIPLGVFSAAYCRQFYLLSPDRHTCPVSSSQCLWTIGSVKLIVIINIWLSYLVFYLALVLWKLKYCLFWVMILWWMNLSLNCCRWLLEWKYQRRMVSRQFRSGSARFPFCTQLSLLLPFKWKYMQWWNLSKSVILWSKHILTFCQNPWFCEANAS